MSETTRIVEVSRRTLQRWVKEKKISAPTPGIVRGRLVNYWTDEEVARIKEYKRKFFSGKGFDRRTGKKAKGTKT
ncbi:MAG TPA: MerR family transcriptional regulator [Candidatus Dormibacteraeota bacterium]|nr:MerR family transcriptional regulator [Candidatus Dormibacteraeota bacterium]